MMSVGNFNALLILLPEIVTRTYDLCQIWNAFDVNIVTNFNIHYTVVKA